MLMDPCSQAAKAAAEGEAKTADEADAVTHEVKQEKVEKIAQCHKNRTPLQFCCSHRVALLTRVQGETAEGTEKKADAENTQDAKICVDYEPCKKTEGCSRLCPIGQKHRGACVVGGKMLKPDKMQTDDEQVAG